ncbi:MAG: HAMP domain-containing histidine kinase [Oscillospiraceae bacterium]|jgi:signal transduction histidine kinase|nr:HAMP domain-containing histidine kinase [Oscillospiraceae bacterium]
MKHLFRDNFLILTAVVLITVSVLGAAFMSLSFSFLKDELNRNTDNTAAVAAANAEAALTRATLDDSDLKITLISVAGASGTHIVITDVNGIIVNCSDPELVCPEIGQTLTPSKGYSKSEEIEYNGALYGYAIAQADSSPVLWKAFLIRFVFVAGAVVIIAAVISIPVTKRQIAPARAMAESIEKSEKARREFIANISHELKTPMTSISGFAEAIADGTIPPEKQGKYLNAIRDEVTRLSRLVQRMLDITRTQTVNPVAKKNLKFDVAELAWRTLFSLEQKINAKRLDVNALIPDSAVTAIGEEDTIAQVIYNLLDNAVKFSCEGGNIALKIWKTGGSIYVSVKNSGETIPAEELPLIFDRFHKSDRSRSTDKEGLGLGLHIVKSILDSYGEKISATSANGLTEFVFTLTEA